MRLIPLFFAEIECTQSKECVLVSFENFLGRNGEQLTALRDSKTTGLVLQSTQSNIIFHNSFSPDIYILPSAQQTGSKLRIGFALKKSVQIILGIYLFLCVTMETALIFSVIAGSITISPAVLLPLMLMLFAYLLSVLFLKIYSNYWLREITQHIPFKKKSELHLRFCLPRPAD